MQSKPTPVPPAQPANPPATKAASPTHGAAPPKVGRPVYCVVIEEDKDGIGSAIIRIEPEVMRRLKLRADKHDLGDYLWENVFRAALYGHVY